MHKHTGIDSPRIKGTDVDDLILDDEVMHTENAETIADVKTLSSIPILPAVDATTDNQMVRKKQVDDNVISSEVDASTQLIDSADTERAIESDEASYNKDKQVTFNEEDGDITVKFDLKDDNGAGGCFGKVYKNGSPVGVEREETAGGWVTYEEDFSVVTGDKIQLYTKYDDSGGGVGGNCRNFRMYYTRVLTPTLGTVNLN